MRLAIVRTSGNALDIKSYNVQEIGLAKGLSKLGIEVDIYSKFAGINASQVFYEGEHASITLHPLKGISYRQLTWFPGLVKAVNDKNYDWIQVHEDSSFMNPILLQNAKKEGRKTILYQGMYKDYSGLGRGYQIIFNLFFYSKIKKHTDTFLAKTNRAKQYLLKKGIKKVEQFPVGLDFRKKDTTPSENVQEIEQFAKKHEYNLLYLGVLEGRRNVKFLIDLLAQLSKDEKYKSVSLIIVGKGPDQQEVSNHINKMGLDSNVLMIESVRNDILSHIFELVDIFLLPTFYEIFGMVILESLYFGTPVISTKEAGPEEIIKSELLGKTIDLDLDKWELAVKKYLSSRDSENNMKNKRKEYIVQNYNWDCLATRYKEIIDG